MNYKRYLIINAENKILCVFGAALRKDAEEKWEKLKPFARLIEAVGDFHCGMIYQETSKA